MRCAHNCICMSVITQCVLSQCKSTFSFFPFTLNAFSIRLSLFLLYHINRIRFSTQIPSTKAYIWIFRRQCFPSIEPIHTASLTAHTEWISHMERKWERASEWLRANINESLSTLRANVFSAASFVCFNCAFIRKIV